MVSKKNDEQTQETPPETPEDAVATDVTPLEATPVEEPAAPQSDTPIVLHNGVTYLERTWRELPMYQCPECPYNNVELEDFAVYQARTCKRPECPIPAPTMAVPQRSSTVVDRFGNPVIVTERE